MTSDRSVKETKNEASALADAGVSEGARRATGDAPASAAKNSAADGGSKVVARGRRFFSKADKQPALVLIGVLAATLLAIAGSPRARARSAAHHFIVGAGVVSPTESLLLLLAYGLSAMSSRTWHGDDPAASRITVVGEQWWSRVFYHLPDGTDLESANELVIPVGEPVVLSRPRM